MGIRAQVIIHAMVVYFCVYVYVHTPRHILFWLASLSLCSHFQRHEMPVLLLPFLLFFYHLIPLPLPLHRLFITFYTEFGKEDKKNNNFIFTRIEIYVFPIFLLLDTFPSERRRSTMTTLTEGKLHQRNGGYVCPVHCLLRWHCLCYYLEGI